MEADLWHSKSCFVFSVFFLSSWESVIKKCFQSKNLYPMILFSILGKLANIGKLLKVNKEILGYKQWICFSILFSDWRLEPVCCKKRQKIVPDQFGTIQNLQMAQTSNWSRTIFCRFLQQTGSSFQGINFPYSKWLLNFEFLFTLFEFWLEL